MRKALQLADTAQQALPDLCGKAGNASRWSTYDTFLGGGKIATALSPGRGLGLELCRMMKPTPVLPAVPVRPARR